RVVPPPLHLPCPSLFRSSLPATARRRWLCCSPEACSVDRDDHATGRPLVYRATPRLLQLLGAETLEEVRGRLGETGKNRGRPGSGGAQDGGMPETCAPSPPMV